MLPTSSALSSRNKPSELGWQGETPKNTSINLETRSPLPKYKRFNWKSKKNRKSGNHYSASTGPLLHICFAPRNTVLHNNQATGLGTSMTIMVIQQCQSSIVCQIFSCKLMTLLTSLILHWLLMIRGLRVHTPECAHATKHFHFDARQTLTEP